MGDTNINNEEGGAAEFSFKDKPKELSALASGPKGPSNNPLKYMDNYPDENDQEDPNNLNIDGVGRSVSFGCAEIDSKDIPTVDARRSRIPKASMAETEIIRSRSVDSGADGLGATTES